VSSSLIAEYACNGGRRSNEIGDDHDYYLDRGMEPVYDYPQYKEQYRVDNAKKNDISSRLNPAKHISL
jgi:hypothetical protein